MNKKHFGDSYDIVKKSLLCWLSEFGPWAGHPMFTDRWGKSAAEEFARLLAIPLISTARLTAGCDRRKYFACCRDYPNSLFLDPDTGVRMKGSGRLARYLYANELIELTKCRPNSLTLVFDQSLARGREQGQIREKLKHFRSKGLHEFAYVSHASIVVLGCAADLVKEAQEQVLRQSGLPRNRIMASRDS